MTSAARDLMDTGTPGPWWRMQADGWSFHSPTAIEVGSAADRADARKIVVAARDALEAALGGDPQ